MAPEDHALLMRIAVALDTIATEVRAARLDAENRCAIMMARDEERDAAMEKARVADTDRRLQAAREDLETYTDRMRQIMEAQDKRVSELQLELDAVYTTLGISRPC